MLLYGRGEAACTSSIHYSLSSSAAQRLSAAGHTTLTDMPSRSIDQHLTYRLSHCARSCDSLCSRLAPPRLGKDLTKAAVSCHFAFTTQASPRFDSPAPPSFPSADYNTAPSPATIHSRLEASLLCLPSPSARYTAGQPSQDRRGRCVRCRAQVFVAGTVKDEVLITSPQTVHAESIKTTS